MLEHVGNSNSSMRDKLRHFSMAFSNLNNMAKLRFRLHASNSTIQLPFTVTNIDNLFVGTNVFIGGNAWFDLGKNTKVYIGNSTGIGRYCQISGGWAEMQDHIRIGATVMMGDRVFMTTTDHDYTDISKSIREQQVVSKGSITIENDSWIGVGACIMPGVRIGRHVVIGANSVVTNSIPAYSVAVGNPAKVIKKYDFKVAKWV